MRIESRLTELGISLPTAPAPLGAYVPVVNSGDLVFVSGQLPVCDGQLLFQGKVDRELKLELAQEAARLCAVNALAALKAHFGTLEGLRRIVRLEVYVNSTPDFADQGLVANAASQLFEELLGPAGQHSRIAVGVYALPRQAAVELAVTAEWQSGGHHPQ